MNNIVLDLSLRDVRAQKSSDKFNKNTRSILARTNSENLDNDRSLKRSLLVSRLGCTLDNEQTDNNENNILVQAEIHQKGKQALRCKFSVSAKG